MFITYHYNCTVQIQHEVTFVITIVNSFIVVFDRYNCIVFALFCDNFQQAKTGHFSSS